MSKSEKIGAILAGLALGVPGGLPLLLEGHGGVLRLPVVPHPKDRDYGPQGKKGSRKNGGRKWKSKKK